MPMGFWRLGFWRRGWVWGVAVALGLAAGWVGAGAPAAGGRQGPAGPPAARWVFRDDLGQRVTLPGPPRRIACSGRDLCDLARALLGGEDGGTVTVLPPGAEIQHLRPGAVDLVLLPAVTRQPGLARTLRARGWAVATLRWQDVGELPAAAERLAGWLHRPGRGREVAGAYRRRLHRVAAAVGSVPWPQRPPVLVLAWDQPPVWAGPGSPAAALVERAGGRLLDGGGIGRAGEPVPPRSGWRARLGALARRAGLASLVSGPGWQTGEDRWRSLPWSPAVRVVTPLLAPAVPAVPGGPPVATALYLPPGQLLGVGPAALDGLERLAAWLHPDRLPSPDDGPPHRLVPLRTIP